jgi:multiple sugar transport system ATP-binding protein
MTLAHRVAILERGILQQLATPAEIYNDPANLFVAQFIGSPPMNVIHGKLDGQDFVTNGVRVQTTASGQIEDGVMGVRPEDCSLATPSEGTLTCTIYTNELIGDHALVTVEWGDDQISVKAPKDFTGEQGDEVGVHIPRNHIFVFDRADGRRVR